MEIKNIKMNNKFIGFGLAVIIAALIINLAAGQFSDQGKFVEVKGLSERIVKADTAIWPLTIQVRSNSVDGLYADLEKDIAATKSFLIEQGFVESEINVAPITVYEDTYQEALYRFSGSVQMSVYTDKVDLVRSASTKTLDLIKRGVVVSGNYIDFQFTELNDIKPEMLAEAIANAKLSAAEFASDSNVRLGKISRANQGVFSITEKDPGSPEYKKVRVVPTLRFLLR